MLHKHQYIVQIVDILFTLGVEDVVISPGSRNAPLTNAFYAKFGLKCTSIVDERSAAYYALGKSLQTQKPSILVCTSGTAALNYAPAVAEAYFQGVPLLVLTADRPPELISQQDNQTIYQTNLYGKNIKKSFEFPADVLTNSAIKKCEEIIREAYEISTKGFNGPVHINIPLREPLYDELPKANQLIPTPEIQKKENKHTVPNEFLESWNNANSIYIICGQSSPNNELKEAIERIAKDHRVVVFTEAISNIQKGVTICSPDVSINVSDKNISNSGPTMVVYFGGHVVSKKLKNFLQEQTHAEFYFVEDSERIIDTYRLLKNTLRISPSGLLNVLPIKEGKANSFKKYWKNKNVNCLKKSLEYLEHIPFSDLKVYEKISELLPKDAIVIAGNSSAVRYLHYFGQKNRIFYANRGTSGIDGCLSSAAGIASKTNREVYAILGDLSFIYDSNALWNRDFPKNLKIIVVNNKGGGIFKLIQGPSDHASYNDFFKAHHPVKMNKIAEAFGFKHIYCNTKEQLNQSIQQITGKNVDRVILEIETPDDGDTETTKDFFNYIKSENGK